MVKVGQFTKRKFPDLSAGRISDVELSELALSADPDGPVADGATPLQLAPAFSPGLISAWCMSAISARRVSVWRMWVMLFIVGLLLMLEALGLCSVFGQVMIG